MRIVYNSIDKWGSIVAYYTEGAFRAEDGTDESDTYIEERNPSRSLFDNINCQTLMSLRVGAKVVATQKISRKMPCRKHWYCD